MIPDAEVLVGAYLRSHADITALEARVVTRTPETLAKPWIRYSQLDAGNEIGSTPEHLLSYLVQFDCYAGDEAMRSHLGQTEASDLARSVRAALHEMPDEEFAGAEVSNVRFLSMPHLPDQDFEPERERYILDAEITLHPR